MNNTPQLNIQYVPLQDLIMSDYNPRTWSDDAVKQLQESIRRHGIVDPLLVNSAPKRKNIIIGGNFRATVLRDLGYDTAPVVYLHIPDIKKEKELNLRLNKNTGEFDLKLLADFDESLLSDIGFSSEELDSIFEMDAEDVPFDLDKELKKINIDKINVQKGDVYDLDGSRLCCGDSTIEADMVHLMGDTKADMVMTDPPYRLQYLKKNVQGTVKDGFGSKKNRKYLETDDLPADFTELWMNNVAKVQADNFSIICYENWKNIREIWNEMEKHWKVRNMIVWHLPNRNQGYAGKHKFFSKHDIAMVGTSTKHSGLILKPEQDELLENEYTTALFAISNNPHWESYGKGKKYCPTDFIEYKAADEQSSGQGIIFGTKPIQILIPYIKVLTTRDQVVLEPFGGSGSTLIACTTLKRRCFIMEKSPIYAEVISNRWEKLTGKKRVKII